ncbi:hypothetical protein EI94DRAFT_1023342 [Lactarius quietus]|nr:hypothetical protein EI94DRAFT_1023342 [Lactarius quietus]
MGVIEIAELYVKLYTEMLIGRRSVAVIVKAVWKLVGGGKQLGIEYDQYAKVCALYPPHSSLALIAKYLRHTIQSKG